MSNPDTSAPASKGMPLWVKVQGTMVVVLVVVVLAMSGGLLDIGLLTGSGGGHGGGHGAPMGPH